MKSKLHKTVKLLHPVFMLCFCIFVIFLVHKVLVHSLIYHFYRDSLIGGCVCEKVFVSGFTICSTKPSVKNTFHCSR